MPSKRFKTKRSLHETFKEYRNIIANLTRISKEKQYKNYFRENTNNLCKTWQCIKQIILIKKTNDKQLNCLKVNKILKSKRTYTISDYLENRNLNSLLLSPATESKIEKINMFSEKNAVGPHSILT